MNLDLKHIREKMADATARFDAKKKEALAHDAVIVERQKKKDECLEEMAKLQGEYRALAKLEKELGGDSTKTATLPGNRADRRRAPKKK